ncbi:hypothetical protein ACFQ9X_06745 [Catenulispora yoronensis]
MVRAGDVTVYPTPLPDPPAGAIARAMARLKRPTGAEAETAAETALLPGRQPDRPGILIAEVGPPDPAPPRNHRPHHARTTPKSEPWWDYWWKSL